MVDIEELRYLFYIGMIYKLRFKLFNNYCILSSIILHSYTSIGCNINVGRFNGYFCAPQYQYIDVSSIKGYVDSMEVYTYDILYSTDPRMTFEYSISLKLGGNFRRLITSILTIEHNLREETIVW